MSLPAGKNNDQPQEPRLGRVKNGGIPCDITKLPRCQAKPKVQRSESARIARYKNPNKAGPRLMVNVGIRAEIEAREQKFNEKNILTREERQQFWSDVITGEIKEKVTVGTGNRRKVVEVEPQVKDRLKASELLGRIFQLQAFLIPRVCIKPPYSESQWKTPIYPQGWLSNRRWENEVDSTGEPEPILQTKMLMVLSGNLTDLLPVFCQKLIKGIGWAG